MRERKKGPFSRVGQRASKQHRGAEDQAAEDSRERKPVVTSREEAQMLQQRVGEQAEVDETKNTSEC